MLHPLNEKHLLRMPPMMKSSLVERANLRVTEADPVSGLKVSTVLERRVPPALHVHPQKICDGAAPFSVQIILSSTWRETFRRHSL